MGAEAHDNAPTVQRGSENAEEVTPLGKQSLHQSCDTGIDGMDPEPMLLMQEYFRKIHCFEAEAIETARRAQVLEQLLNEVRAQIPEKEKEVCNLQCQLAQDLNINHGLVFEVLERDNKISRLLASPHGSKARAPDVGEHRSALETAVQSGASWNAVSSDVARCVRSLSPSNLFRRGDWPLKEQRPQNNYHWKASSAPPSPRGQRRGIVANHSNQPSFGQQFKCRVCETPGLMVVPPEEKSCTEAKNGQTMCDVNRIIPTRVKLTNDAIQGHAGNLPSCNPFDFACWG
mmetsp:Transcript_72333/g.139945  ORF Transcript_72333/g.139945 Transcript_72333/m.139945 type:complete len:288 (+) Transcript_72333:107-970(+)